MQVQSDTELARVLGISKAQVSKHKKLGMPTGDVDAARAWRDAHLSPAKRKDVNTYARSGSGYRSGMVDPQASIARVQALMDLAEAGIGTPTFEALREPLRRAMRDVPTAWRARVGLSPAVLDVLLADIMKMIAGDQPAPHQTSTQEEVAPPPIDDEEAQRMGAFWYAMACGESFAVDDL